MLVEELEELLKEFPNKKARVQVSDTYHQTIDFITPAINGGYDTYTEEEWAEQEEEFKNNRKGTEDVCLLVLR